MTGGARSGKSSFAQEMAEAIKGTRIFIATCPILDKDLEARIKAHRASREGKGWRTIEEFINLKGAIRQAKDAHVVLVDCLTLWINNLLHQAGEQNSLLDEDKVQQISREVLEVARSIQGTVIFVTNEVGMGIVPENQWARHYRDLLGRCNQVFAEGADEVVLMVSAIPVRIKEIDPRSGQSSQEMRR